MNVRKEVPVSVMVAAVRTLGAVMIVNAKEIFYISRNKIFVSVSKIFMFEKFQNL
jgi:hypothetical protein